MSPGVIAILAHPDDPLARATDAELRRQGERVGFLDASAPFRGTGLSWSLSPPTGFLDLDGSIVELSHLRSVLARSAPFSFHASEADGDEAYAEFEAQAAMLGLLAALPGLVVNRPRRIQGLRAVLAQPEATVRCGLKLAPTLVTSEPRAATRFFAETCHQQAVVGPPAAQEPPPSTEGPALTAVSGPAGAEQIREALDHGPVAIHARPGGAWLSALVVGERVIAGARDAQGTLRGAALDADLGLACAELARALDLSFAAVELVVDGDVAVCLDVSGFPQPHPCSGDVEDAVTRALCLLLASGDRP
jgi:hypothetical protein